MPLSCLVCYASACCKHQDFVDRGKLLTSKLLSQSNHRAMLLCEQLESSMGDIMTSLSPKMAVSNLFPILCPQSRLGYQIPDFHFHCLIPRIHRYSGCSIIDR